MYWFWYYYPIAGLVVLLWFWYDINIANKEDVDDMIADVAWNTGVKREYVKVLLYCLALLLGFIILPYELLCKVFNWEE